ncbi:17.9 kDa class II heat shock protein-like [Vicia villosa]|uniref:17.9 kDa class II heat shock protein-like n=1 Tax=Vicia villosa TaxID=3911 RepID=UPI00273B1A25|nr:17.9 kDa class II heat shock protein-like [Vicia villosa]
MKRRCSSSDSSSSSSDSSSSSSSDFSSSSSSDSSSSSSSDSSSSSSSSEKEISTKLSVLNNKNNKKPKLQEKGNPNGKTPVIKKQPPTMTRCDNVEMSAATATTADVKVYPDSYVYEVDMPGLKSAGEIKVWLDDDYLVVSGERKREEGVEYLMMGRKVGKFMHRFVLPKNADADAVSAICKNGVLSVTVQKLPPPPQPKNPRRNVQVFMA